MIDKIVTDLITASVVCVCVYCVFLCILTKKLPVEVSEPIRPEQLNLYNLN